MKIFKNADVLVQILIKKKLKISAIESCTGGMFASALVDVPGVSQVFENSVVAYSYESKTEFAGVKKETYEKNGVVSKETVKEMVIGNRKRSSANINVAISGIAGPEGATPEKPVGLVWFAFDIDGKVKTFSKIFANKDRNQVRTASVKFAINKLIKILDV